MADQPNLQEIHDFLILVAKQAGEKITSARPNLAAIDTKKNSSDLVTETDKAVESLVSSALKAKYPTYTFIGEETYDPSQIIPTTPTFVCDPIDGTTNFVHSHPYVSVSLGFLISCKPVVGVVYNPFTGHLYHGIKGQGSFLTIPLPAGASAPLVTRQLPLRNSNEEPLTLDKALVAVEWGNERDGSNFECKVKTFAALAGAKEIGGGMVHGFRSLGSAALNLCAVAAGELDCYWEGGCWVWDVGAGWVILEEAGGRVVGANKGEWEVPVDGRRYLGVRGAPGGKDEVDRFIESLWECVKGTLVYDA